MSRCKGSNAGFTSQRLNNLLADARHRESCALFNYVIFYGVAEAAEM
jgi:hypothetical protein